MGAGVTGLHAETGGWLTPTGRPNWLTPPLPAATPGIHSRAMSPTTTGFPARLLRIGSAASSLTPMGFARGYSTAHGVPGGGNPTRTTKRPAGGVSRGGLGSPLDRRCGGGFDPLPTTIHVGGLRAGIDLGIIPEHTNIIVEWRDISPGRLERHMDRMTIQTSANSASVHDRADNGETLHPGERIGHSGRGAHNSVIRRPDGRLPV